MAKKGKVTKGAKAQKGLELKRERTAKGVMSVVGSRDVFDENGKLIRPSAKFVADGDGGIDVILKKTAKESQEPLQPVPEKYQKLMDVEFCKVQAVRKTLCGIVDDLEKIPGVYMKPYDGYMSVGYASGSLKRHLLTVNPLRKSFSVQVEKTTKGWTREKVLEKVHKLIDELKLPTRLTND